MQDAPLIYLVAGESSGDLLGARLMAALKKKLEGKIRFAGVGGPQMAKEGLVSFFPMSELSLIGIVEVLPHLPRLLRRWRETAEDIAAKKPALVLTIDVPGFAQKLVRMARQRLGPKVPLVHYVAPTVWAYRPARARHLAKLYDHLLVLLPFEPPYFERVGLPTSFVGHPVVETFMQSSDPAAFRLRHALPDSVRLLAMLPGSRRGEIRRHLPIFRETAEKLRDIPGLTLLMTVPPHLIEEVRRSTQDWPLPLLIVSAEERQDAFAACEAALTKSGTVALELALSNTAMVTMYRVNALSAWLLRRMILIKRFNLINILLGKDIVPELMQEMATPEYLANALKKLLSDPAARERQVMEAQAALTMLGKDDPIPPSERAAQALIALLPQPDPR